MMRHFPTVTLACLLIVLGGSTSAERTAAEIALPLLKSTEPADLCLMPSTPAYAETSAMLQDYGSLPVPADWPGKGVLGGDVPPVQIVTDPHPTFDGIAIDPENGVVVMSDENRASMMMYDVTAGSLSTAVTEPKRHIIGANTNLGYQAGVALDPKNREIFAISNDGGGFNVFKYDDHGDVEPTRRLEVPHQAWGISLDPVNDEMAITSQQYQGISIYRRSASGTDRPLRSIRGDRTLMADPHGVFIEPSRDEVFVANHGNWTEMRSYASEDEVIGGDYVPGRFEKPSIRIYRASDTGNVPPVRSIQGPQSQLAWPMGVFVDAERKELIVANYGNHSILVYAIDANGNAAPTRVISGAKTGIVGPISIAVDPKRNELWVANYGDHTALVFDRAASGDVAPKRIIRNAPAGTPTTGFTNASAAAFDTKRNQILVPN